MSLEWFHVVLAAVFVGIWLIVGQIIAKDRQELRYSSQDDSLASKARNRSPLTKGEIGWTFK